MGVLSIQDVVSAQNYSTGEESQQENEHKCPVCSGRGKPEFTQISQCILTDNPLHLLEEY